MREKLQIFRILFSRATEVFFLQSVVGTVIMDLSKAFDLIPHDLLLAKLSAYGITTHSLNILKSYLTNRRQRVRVEDVTSDI